MNRTPESGDVGADTDVDQPGGLAFGPDGDLFVSEAGSHVVERISPSTGEITLVAGNGTAGRSGDGGPATSAELDSPGVPLFDAEGDLFVPDLDANVIRKVDARSGLISTIAGTGIAGYSGDHGPAASARLDQPTGAVADERGDIYFTDSGNQVVRRIDGVSGIITTIAGTGADGYSGDGGPATKASFNDPDGIAWDGPSTLVVADSLNNRIRRIDLSTGSIRTIAGNGSPGSSKECVPGTRTRLTEPTDIATTPEGTLYIADFFNHRIRVLDGSSGLVTTLVGSGTAGYLWGMPWSVPGPLPPALLAASSGGAPVTASTTIGEPLALAVAPTGQVVFTEPVTNQVVAVSLPNQPKCRKTKPSSKATK